MKETISIHSDIIEALRESGFRYLNVGHFFALTPFYSASTSSCVFLPCMSNLDCYELEEFTLYEL